MDVVICLKVKQEVISVGAKTVNSVLEGQDSEEKPRRPEMSDLCDPDLDQVYLDAFLPDEDPEPLPDLGDFWLERE